MNIHQILATVLHLGNICFDAVYSDTDPAEMSSPPAILERGKRVWRFQAISTVLLLQPPTLRSLLTALYPFQSQSTWA
jgi:hypothetical protein